jgi:hypothetical protein
MGQSQTKVKLFLRHYTSAGITADVPRGAAKKRGVQQGWIDYKGILGVMASDLERIRPLACKLESPVDRDPPSLDLLVNPGSGFVQLS